MPLDVALRNGIVAGPSGTSRCDVGFADGRIAMLGQPGSLPRAARDFDVEGHYVLPGLIDPHTHLGIGDDISDEKMAEDFATVTRDCLVGGVTTIATTTSEGRQPLAERFDRALRCSEGRSWVDHRFTSVVGGRSDIPDIPYVTSRGCVGFKFFTGYAGEQAEEFGMDAAGITPDLFFLACRAIRASSSIGYAAIHAEEPYVREVLVDEARVRRSDSPLAAWLDTSPSWAETVQVVLFGFVAQQADVPLYVVHVSSALTVDTLQFLRGHGLDITAETLALFLNATAEEMDATGIGAKAKIQPPLRARADQNRLWQAMRDGEITIVGSDTLTYTRAFKESQPFWDCRVGINQQFIDTLPLMWHAAVNEGRLPLEKLVYALSEGAARRLSLYPRKGALAPGADADVVVVDPERKLELGSGRSRGGADYSLWEGRKVCGGPMMTFLRGELVMSEGEIVTDAPSGGYLGSGPALAEVR